MINITKQGNNVIVTSDNPSSFNISNGELSVPLNTIYYVLDDESDFIQFNSTEEGNILFNGTIGQIQVNGNIVTRDNILMELDNVFNSSGSGGGTASAGVNSINGYQGDVRIKTVNGTSLIGSGDITIEADLDNYYTKEEVDGKIPDVSNFITSIPSEYITETELNDKGYLTSIPDTYITEGELTTALSDKVSQTALNEAIEGIDVGVKTINNTKGNVNIKTINGESLIGSGDITIEGGSTDLSDYYTKQETNSLIPSTYVSRIEDFNLYTKDAPYKKIHLQYVNSDSETIITKEIILEWSGTQSEYDALGTYDDNITYNIIEG